MMKTFRHRKHDALETPTAIDALRREIDVIDEEILNLINRRLRVAHRIGAHKRENGNPVLDQRREDEILARLGALNRGPLKSGALHHIFSRIIAASREIQKSGDVSGAGLEGECRCDPDPREV